MWMVNGEKGERMEDLGEAGIFIIVSDVCYLLAWDMPNVVREMMSFLYVVVRVFSHSASYATPRPKRLRGCAFLRYKVNRFYWSGPKVS